MISRRRLLSGLLASLAAPAIIRTPGLLMPVRTIARDTLLLTLNDITRASMRLFLNTNRFYDNEFAKLDTKIGQELRIRLSAGSLST